MCQRGQGVVQKLFGRVDDQRLRGIVIWLPMLPGDDIAAAQKQSSLVNDPRILKGWDPARHIGDAFMPILGLSGTAWDVYLLYDRSAHWGSQAPPQPTFWMHQLPESAGAPGDQTLDIDTLEREMRRLLSQPN